jgi:competence protein ComEA
MTHKQQTITAIVLSILALTAFPAVSSAQSAGTVNINSADAATLEFLPRVGPAIAQRILEFREQNGQFKTAEDLMLVKGIGEKTYDLIAPYVTLSGESSLNEKVTVPRSAESGDQE